VTVSRRSDRARSWSGGALLARRASRAGSSSRCVAGVSSRRCDSRTIGSSPANRAPRTNRELVALTPRRRPAGVARVGVAGGGVPARAERCEMTWHVMSGCLNRSDVTVVMGEAFELALSLVLDRAPGSRAALPSMTLRLHEVGGDRSRSIVSIEFAAIDRSRSISWRSIDLDRSLALPCRRWCATATTRTVTISPLSHGLRDATPRPPRLLREVAARARLHVSLEATPAYPCVVRPAGLRARRTARLAVTRSVVAGGGGRRRSLWRRRRLLLLLLLLRTPHYRIRVARTRHRGSTNVCFC